MEPKIVPFIWNAEVIVSRGPVDDPLLVSTSCCATMTDRIGSYGTLLVEENALSWLSKQVGHPIENMTVVSLTWSMLENAETPPRPR